MWPRAYVRADARLVGLIGSPIDISLVNALESVRPIPRVADDEPVF